MISIEEAQGAILSRIPLLEAERVPLFQGLHRVSAEDHISPWDIPPADYSAMDGFAFSHAFLAEGRLRVTGFLPAGEVRTLPVPPGEAIRIMTGAPIPPGCDTVVPLEEAQEEGEEIRLRSSPRAGANVRPRGEDVGRGETAIASGALLRPQEIGMLAAMGMQSPRVFRRARVAVLSTGDELLEPGCMPLPGKIVDSNSYTLAAEVLDAGGEPQLLGIAPDTPEATREKIVAGLDADMLVISGGISVGDRDFVKGAIEDLGGEFLLSKVNMKPGKPMAFALLRGKPVFALPGNPAAALVAFELFVRPSLLKAMGHTRIHRPLVRATLQEPAANSGKRPHLVRGAVSLHGERYLVRTTGNQSSGRLSSVTAGNCLLRLDPGVSRREGEEVEVLLLDRRFELGEAGQPPMP